MEGKQVSPLYYYLLRSIRFQLFEKNKLVQPKHRMLIDSYNISIPLNLNSLIEGYFRDLLNGVISNLDRTITNEENI